MSEEQSPPEQDDEDGPSLFDQPEGVDWFLANLVQMADAYKIEQGVTLNVGGILISGVLISGRSYFEELSGFVKVGAKGSKNAELASSIADSYGQFAQIYPEHEVGEDYPHRPRNYIHLRGTVMFGSNGPMSGPKGLLWRGKLSSVDGYILGQLNQT